MSSAPPSDERTPPAGIGIDPAATAATLREADFVRLVALPDGDALAATGLLAGALRAAGIPFQTRVRGPRPVDHEGADTEGTDTDTLVRVGGRDPAAADVHLPGNAVPASVAAHAIAGELGATGSPTLALAGAVAAGATPGAAGTAPLLEAAERAGAVERRPGLAVPVADLADGLAHATLVRGPFSGAPDRARERLGLDDRPDETPGSDEERRRIASLVAVEAATAPDAPPRAAEAVERLLRPYATGSGPFATLAGGADVLRAVARERPGAGVALTLCDGDADDLRETALAAWRAHGRAVHGLLDDASDGTTERHGGLFVVRADEASLGRVWTAARLLRDFRSPEPAALVVGDGVAAVAATSDEAISGVADALAAAGSDPVAVGADRTAAARFDDDARNVIETVREATA